MKHLKKLRVSVSPWLKFSSSLQRNRILKIIAVLFLLINSGYTKDQNHVDVGIDEKLGSYIPLDISFNNEKGELVKLNQLIKQPTILALVYYHCPAVCSPLLNGLTEVVDKLDLEPQKDFDVITLSFDHSEGPTAANKWKKEHLASMKRDFPESAWTFLTGDSISIKKLTDAVGFYFKRDTDSSFLHYGTLIILSEKGMISRYIFGIQFNQFDVKMALLEAQRGEYRPTINKILTFCYSYDRSGNKYVFNFQKIAGGIILLSALILFTVLIIKERKKSKEKI
ncbi:MAG: SCO family protein [Ignavibacteriales bacterium]|nr:SCO family protein [Ignavibacteriales bacterium]